MKKLIRKFDHKIIHNTELELNSIDYDGIEIGILLSNYFNVLYADKYNKSWLKKSFLFVCSRLKSILNKKKVINYQKEILYYCSGPYNHLINLQSSLSDNVEIEKKTLFVSYQKINEFEENIFFLSGVADFFKTLIFLFKNLRSLNKIISPLKLSFLLKFFFVIELHMQLLKAVSLTKFVKAQTKINLIGADYDRGYESSLFFAVAKALKIKNFVLQHGAINPPIGYYPVNSSEIWVWGEMAKKQLIELGVSSKKIFITGTPIINNIKFSDSERLKITKKYDLKLGVNIVLALSSPDKPRDIEQVKFFSELKKSNPNLRDNFIVKIHPSRNYDDYKWIEEKFNITILPANIALKDFMNIVDILLTHSSSLANEAIYYSKKVGILDILDLKPMNGMELHKYLKVPLIKASSNIKDLYNIEKKDSGKLLFYEVGDKAKIEIQKRIQNHKY